MKNNRKTTAFGKGLLKNLAEDVHIKITDNKILQETIKIYNEQADTIKYLMGNYSRNLKSYSKSKALKDFEDYNSHLNLLLKKTKSKIQKLDLKNKALTQKLSENSSADEELLTKIKEDNFILKYAVKEKNDLITNVQNIDDTFRYIDETRIIPKYEFEVNQRVGFYYLDKMSSNVQQKLLCFSRAFNNNKNKNNKNIKKINELRKKIEFLKKYIELFEFLPKNDIDFSKFNNSIGILNNNAQINITFKGVIINNNFYPPQSNQNQIKSKKTVMNSTKNINRVNISNDKFQIFQNFTPEKKKKQSKFNLIKIDELLSISNIECENEDLIDAELHSDDEMVFENKISSSKTIINDYSSNINKTIPKLDLNQIEFNKLKVMDECDMYSLRKRKYKASDANEVLEITRDEVQKYKEKIKLNKKKCKAIKSYIDELKNDYKLLRKIKLTTSICMPNKVPNLTKISEINEISIKKPIVNRENKRYDYTDMNSDDQENNEIISTEEMAEIEEEEDNVIIDCESINNDKESKIPEFKSARNITKLESKFKKINNSGNTPKNTERKNDLLKKNKCKFSDFMPKSK